MCRTLPLFQNSTDKQLLRNMRASCNGCSNRPNEFSLNSTLASVSAKHAPISEGHNPLLQARKLSNFHAVQFPCNPIPMQSNSHAAQSSGPDTPFPRKTASSLVAVAGKSIHKLLNSHAQFSHAKIRPCSPASRLSSVITQMSNSGIETTYAASSPPFVVTCSFT